jgi:DNA-binding transcriptional regulator YiaG
MKEQLVYWFGFPTIVEGVGFVTMGGYEVFDVCPDVVEEKALHLLTFGPHRLTGAQFKFFRFYLNMTQAAMAEALHQTNHSIVSQWESKLDESTNMNQNTEILLRLLVAKEILGKVSLGEVLDRLQALPFSEPVATLRIKVSEAEIISNKASAAAVKPAKPRPRPRTKAAVNVNNAPPV